MSKFGIIYMGSKSSLIHKIAPFIPESENFYDLFGGGFAVSHFMLLNRACHVHYNELESTTVELIKDAIAGKYSYERFRPEWVTREMFFARKDRCAYTRIVWSFGNNQRTYLYSQKIESYKRSLHMAVVFNEFDDMAKGLLGMTSWPTSLSIKERRLMVGNVVYKKHSSHSLIGKPPMQLQHLERLERLQKLEQIKQADRLTMTAMSYDEVPIKPNSIIYCDPPYKRTERYHGALGKIEFNHDRFWDWVRHCPYPVYVSEYNAPDFMIELASFNHKKSVSSFGNTDSTEKLFWNGKLL
jgi:site-specific DNA-adenine methylase